MSKIVQTWPPTDAVPAEMIQLYISSSESERSPYDYYRGVALKTIDMTNKSLSDAAVCDMIYGTTFKNGKICVVYDWQQ